MTTNRVRSMTRVVGAAGTLVLALGVAPVAAQEDSRWLAWQGCWQPTSDPLAGDVAAEAQAYVVCVAPAEGGARFTTVADGETVAERTVVADGVQRPIDQAGCQGWETARWSQDEQRVYLRSELTCEGGTERVTTGVLTMATPEQWLDVQGVAAGDNHAVRVRRYRIASEARMRAAGAQQELGDRSLALATARTAAAQELSLNDVREATTLVAAPVVEAMLVERQSYIGVDAEALISLADAGVPTSVIDLLVAQANPDKFMIDRDARTVGDAPEAERAYDESDRYRRPPIYAGWGYDPWGYDPFWYGYGSRYGYGYGYRDPFSYYYGGSPRIIVIQPDDGFDDDRGGRMVKGRGYVPRQGSTSDSDARGSSRSGSGSSVGSTSSGSGSSGSASSGSGSSSSGSTGRKAKPRGGGGGF